MEVTKTRLNKYLAQCGICSRREADKMIQQGNVTRNGNVCGMGEQVTLGDIVCVNGKILTSPDEKVVLAFYKPIGVTCTEKDKYVKKSITEYLNYPIRVTYAGRLDQNSEGLMIMTNDGDLIHQMMRGANKHEKEYIVTVNKSITETFLKQMSEGLFLKELNEITRPCVVTQVEKDTFHIILTQGLNRQIRRMCETLGFEVTHLKRIRIMNILIDGLKSGEYRQLTKEEQEILYRQLG